MKKLLALLLCTCLFVGCSADSSTASVESSAQSEASSETAVATATPEPTVAPTEGEEGLMPLTGLAGEDATARPIAIMISNAAAATTQWGIQSASVVIEALTEGSETNLALLFDSLADVPKTGPVSEAKDLFWQFAIAQNAILVQNDWNIYAENLLNCYNYQPIDAMFVGVNSFDYDSALGVQLNDEFCWYTKGSSLQTSITSYGIATQGEVSNMFNFGNATGTAGGQTLTIAYSSATSSTFDYDSTTGLYAMSRTDGSAQIDANSGEQVTFSNVLILSATASIKDNKYTRDYDLTSGTGLYLTNGEWQVISWVKGDVTAVLQLFDADGNPLTVSTGQTYIGIYGGISGQSVSLLNASGTELANGDTIAMPAVE